MATYKYGGQALVEGVLMRGRNALAVALRHPDGSIVWATERLDLGLRARRALKMPFLRGLVVLYDTLVTGTRWLVRSATLQALALDGGDGDKPKTGSSAVTSTLGGVIQTVALAFSGPALCAAGSTGDDAQDAPKDSQAETASALKVDATPYTDPDAVSGTSAGRPAATSQGMGKGYNVAVGGMLLLSLVLGIGIFFLIPLFLAQATVGRVDQGFGLQLAEGLIRVVIFIGYLMVVGRAGDVRRTFM